MSSLRRLITAVIIVLTVALQSTVVAQWNLPGATPDIVLVVVSAFAVRHAPARAAIIGFLAGLLLDATPPATGLLGLNALAFVIIAFAASQLRTDLQRSPFGPLAFIGAASAASVIVRSALSGLLGATTVPWSQLPVAALSQAFYCALLATIVVPIVRALLGVLMPAPVEVIRR